MAKDTTDLQPLVDEIHQLRLSIESRQDTTRQLEDIRRTLEDIERTVGSAGGSSD